MSPFYGPPSEPNPKPEPMQRPEFIETGWQAEWFIRPEEYRLAEAERLYALTLEKERDRLSTALVAANAELVTERSRVADLAEVIRVTLDLDDAREFSPEKYREMRNKGRVLLAAIASDAPAMADTHEPGCPLPAELAKSPENRIIGVYCTCRGDVFNNHAMQQAAAKFAAGAAAPASKPLVVGEVYALSSLPEGARVADLSTGDEWEIRGHDALGRVIDSDGDYREPHLHKLLVALPSAKADEGKAEDLTAGCEPCPRGCGGYKVVDRPCAWKHPDPAPPALTREEVVEMIVIALMQPDKNAVERQRYYVEEGERMLRAALSDGGAK